MKGYLDTGCGLCIGQSTDESPKFLPEIGKTPPKAAVDAPWGLKPDFGYITGDAK